MTRQTIERAQIAIKVLCRLASLPPASDGRVQHLLSEGHQAVMIAYQNAMQVFQAQQKAER